MKFVHLLGLGLMALALVITGCENNKGTNKGSSATLGTKVKSTDEPHTHGKGPNDGVVFDFGKNHAEFTVDHKTKEATVLIIVEDKKDTAVVPISAKELTLTTKETKTKEGKVVPPMTIKLLPVDAKDGKASKFVGKDEGLGNVADFEGTVIGEVDGKPAKGEFKE